jgi:hypothetical protein
MEATGFLMMAHGASPHEIAERARVHEAADAQIVYCTDNGRRADPRRALPRESP